EGRQVRPPEIAVQAGGGVEEPVLEHVGGVEPALDPRVHAELDHPVEAIPIALEQVGERLAVAGAEPLDELPGVGRFGWHVETSPYHLTCAPVGDWASRSGNVATGEPFRAVHSDTPRPAGFGPFGATRAAVRASRSADQGCPGGSCCPRKHPPPRAPIP